MPFLGAVAALAVALVLAAPAQAGQLSPGRPDITFAGDGTLRTSLGYSEISAEQIVPLRSGRLAVLTSVGKVIRLRASGRLDRTFGRRGFPPPDRYARALAEAPDGGLVIAGTKRGDALAVRRLLANGRPDRRFGPGGLVTFETGTFLSGIDAEIAPDGTAFVATLSVAPNDYANRRLLVFAIDPSGRLVPAFGDGGVAAVPLPWFVAWYFAGLVRLPDGRLRYAANGYDPESEAEFAVLVGITADGRPDPALGPRGARRVAAALPPIAAHMASDASGRLLLTATRRHGRVIVAALTPDGERDRTFGDDGVARVTLPFAAVSGNIATLAGGGVAVTVTKLCCPRRPAALLLRRDGSVARGFGRRGVAVVSRFPKGPAYLDALAVDHLDRLVLGGLSGDGLSGIREDFGPDRLAMARIRARPAPVSLPSRAEVGRTGVMHVPVRCRARTGCRAELSVVRGRVRGRAFVRLDAGARREVRVRLGAAAVRLAERRRRARLTATVTAAGRTEPVAVSVRLRTTAAGPRTG